MIDLAKAWVVEDFGRRSPERLRDDFGLLTRGERLTKKRYLKNGDLEDLRSACGGSLAVSASDYRVDPGDGRTVWFTLVLSGKHAKRYAAPSGVDARAALAATKRPFRTLPSAGSCSFDEAGRCYAASLGVPMDRDDANKGADGIFVANDKTIRDAVALWCSNRTAAETKYGVIANWDVT